MHHAPQEGVSLLLLAGSKTQTNIISQNPNNTYIAKTKYRKSLPFEYLGSY